MPEQEPPQPLKHEPEPEKTDESAVPEESEEETKARNARREKRKKLIEKIGERRKKGGGQEIDIKRHIGTGGE